MHYFLTELYSIYCLVTCFSFNVSKTPLHIFPLLCCCVTNYMKTWWFKTIILFCSWFCGSGPNHIPGNGEMVSTPQREASRSHCRRTCRMADIFIAIFGKYNVLHMLLKSLLHNCNGYIISILKCVIIDLTNFNVCKF